MTTFFLDMESGNDANDGTTFANRWKTLDTGATAARIAPGDVIRIKETASATSLGVTALWTDNSSALTLTSAVNQTVDNCEGTWTASANVTFTSSTTNYRQGTKSVQLAIAAGFTTGLAGYGGLANINLSSYQQISCWIKPSIAVAAGVLELKLCSDALGVTALDTLALPAMPHTNCWYPVVIDKGSALSSGINSIALYAVSDPGTLTINFDNIIACKAPSAADSLNLRSMIGKNTVGEPEWWPIQSIDGTAITFNGSIGNTAAGVTMKYQGTTETVTTHKRESLMLTAMQNAMEAGTAAAYIEYSFGWDRTAMTTQSGETWLSRECITSSSAGYATCSFASRAYNKITKFRVHGTYYGLFLSNSTHLWFYDFACTGVQDAINPSSSGSTNITVEQLDYAICVQYGFHGSAASVTPSHSIKLKGRRLIGPGNGGTLVCAIEALSTLDLDVDFQEFVGWGWTVYFGGRASTTILRNAKIWRGTNSLIAAGTSEPSGVLRCFNVDPQDTISASFHPIHIMKYGRTANDHRIFWQTSKTIASATDQRKTASDYSWKFDSTNTNGLTSLNPMSLSLGQVAVKASALVTITLWVRRNSTGISIRMRVPGGYIGGVADDVSANAAAAIDTWEQLSLTFTPNEAGVVPLFCEAWGSAVASGWCDDLSVTQA